MAPRQCKRSRWSRSGACSSKLSPHYLGCRLRHTQAHNSSFTLIGRRFGDVARLSAWPWASIAKDYLQKACLNFYRPLATVSGSHNSWSWERLHLPNVNRARNWTFNSRKKLFGLTPPPFILFYLIYVKDFPTELKHSDLGDLRVLLIIQNDRGISVVGLSFWSFWLFCTMV